MPSTSISGIHPQRGSAASRSCVTAATNAARRSLKPSAELQQDAHCQPRRQHRRPRHQQARRCSWRDAHTLEQTGTGPGTSVDGKSCPCAA